MESKIGLVIQFTGIFLIAVLSLFLRRTVKTPAATYWAAAWFVLSLSLFSLSFAFNYPQFGQPLFSLYFFGEYVFGFLLILGTRSLAKNYQPDSRFKLILIPFALLAICLPALANDFNFVFNLHAFLFATFFAAAFFTLRHSEIKSFGWRVISVAVALLALDFYNYALVFTLLSFGFELPLISLYLSFDPIIDLVLEILLGFGMVIFLLEQLVQEVQSVNEQLAAAHIKLEQLAHIDPLTTAFNRHAFYGYLKKRGADGSIVSGCVGFFDIDDLKPINDNFGHTVGDAVIRVVVRTIRAVIRAEDLIFRWGGDEFFAIMVGMNAEMARTRMEDLERMLTEIEVEGAKQPLTIRVSYGFTNFAEASELEGAVKSADEEMYERKQQRKLRQQSNPQAVFNPDANAPSSLNI